MGFPLHKPHKPDILLVGEYLHFRYLSEMFGDKSLWTLTLPLFVFVAQFKSLQVAPWFTKGARIVIVQCTKRWQCLLCFLKKRKNVGDVIMNLDLFWWWLFYGFYHEIHHNFFTTIWVRIFVGSLFPKILRKSKSWSGACLLYVYLRSLDWFFRWFVNFYHP